MTETKDKVDAYIQLYQTILDRVGETPAAVAVFEEVVKDFKIGPRTRVGFTGSEDTATEKQLKFLRNLGVDPQLGLTKVEASKLIDATLAEEACVYSVA